MAGDAAAGVPQLFVRREWSERERTRILAADNDPQTLRYVRDALAKAGYAPIVTGDPQEATSLVEANAPHLLLLDLMLTGTDGIELMRDILDIADVPVNFLSVYGQDEIIARAFEKRADDYVVSRAQAASARMGRAHCIEARPHLLHDFGRCVEGIGAGAPQ